MSIESLLRDLESKDIRITLKGDKLSVNAPEGALTPDLRSAISSRRGELLAFLSDGAEVSNGDLELKRAPDRTRAPLSFAQQRLWFLNKLDPTDTAYHLGISLELPEQHDKDALSKAIETLALQHDVLRTVFHETDGVPVQVVTDTVPHLEYQEIVLPSQDETERLSWWQKVRDEEVRRPFQLADVPPIRGKVFEIKDGSSILLIVIHHIITDGWSLDMMVDQITELYETYSNGGTVDLEGDRWQYADYAYSEREWFDSMDQKPHIDYWSQKLGGQLPTLELPTDRVAGQVRKARGAAYSFTVPPPLTEKLRVLGHQSGVTLFSVMFAVFKTLLYRYTGEDDIIVGTPVANRKRVELESLLGFFVSTTVLRTSLEGNPSFQDVVRRVHGGILDAHEYQDLPFEKIVEIVRPDRSLSQLPLFQTAFIMTPGTTDKRYESVDGGAIFDLSCYLWDQGEELTATFAYNAELFNEDTIERMAGHLLTLAESAVADPGAPIGKLAMLRPEERKQLVETWNATTTEYPRNSSVHELFEAQVDATPDAIAVTVPQLDGGDARNVTYRELDRSANQLAHHMQSLGVTQGSAVGIVLERSLDCVTAILAALKCGAAYVPMDPALPAERLSTMLGDAGAAVVITTQLLFDAVVRSALPANDVPVVFLDTQSAEISSKPTDRPGVDSDAEAVAYLMYTSGSTGKPKGVAIPHRAIVRLVRNTNYIELTERDVILACAPVSFDASTLEIWGSILNGGRLVIYPNPLPEPREIGRLIQEEGITTLWLTAGLFHLVVDTHADSLAGLTQLLAGGDVLSPGHVKKALKALRGGALVNGYGPTENTTFTCCYRMTREEQVGDVVPVGRPISNTRVYVLDANMEPVPIGVRGELWTSGDGLALGYHNDRALTEEKFQRDPFSTDPQARLYRTGDIVRYRKDGIIEFNGRRDNQVKIRGFRIELGEIEHALMTYPAVKDALVAVRDHGAGSKQLVAYIIPADRDNEAALKTEKLNSFLSQHLPDYAIPAVYVTIDAFPLTPNGKVDYRALPAPTVTVTSVEDDIPQTPLESQLLAIWQEVLGANGMGRNDNFFNLGGNSLLGIRLLATIEKALGIRVPVTVLFQGQTVATMAQAISSNDADASSYAIPIQARGSKPPLFFVPGVNGNVIGYENMAKGLGPDQPLYGLRSAGLEGDEKPLYAIPSIASTFVKHMKHVQPAGPYNLLGICMGGIVAFEIARQLHEANDEVGALIMVDAWPPEYIAPSRWSSRLGQQVSFVADGVSRHWKTLWEQPNSERLQYLRDKMGIVSEMIKKRDVYRGEQHVLRADLVKAANQTAAALYQPKPYAGSMHLILTRDNRHGASDDVRLQWQEYATGGCEVKWVPGIDSGSLLREPYVGEFVRVLQKTLYT